MKKHIRANLIQWHREQRDRALTRDNQRDADRHARIIKELSDA